MVEEKISTGPCNYLQKGPDKYLEKAECIIKDIVGREKTLSNEKYPFLSMSLAYKPSGPIPGYKPMGFYAGWAYMRGNMVYKLISVLNSIIDFCF